MVPGKALDRSGYLKDFREDHTEEANEPIENLMELVSAAREYETREARTPPSPDSSIGCRCWPRPTRNRGPATRTSG